MWCIDMNHHQLYVYNIVKLMLKNSLFVVCTTRVIYNVHVRRFKSDATNRSISRVLATWLLKHIQQLEVFYAEYNYTHKLQ